MAAPTRSIIATRADQMFPRFDSGEIEACAVLRAAPLCQEFASQLQQQKAAVEAAANNLNVAQQQVESLKAQRSSAEASLTQAKAQLRQAEVNLAGTYSLAG